jgi:hypothetical protein
MKVARLILATRIFFTLLAPNYHESICQSHCGKASSPKDVSSSALNNFESLRAHNGLWRPQCRFSDPLNRGRHTSLTPAIS